MARAATARCLIAAGGTAGHVLPALAVAEALSARGARVTFAGSPDRVEARLVPEAGYELDTFRDQRPPAPAGRSRCCARSLLRRRARRARAGGSSRGGGPTSCSAAAATSPGRWCSRRRDARIPAALTEADAHLGLANRLAAPFARRVFLAFPIAGPRRRRSTASSAGRSRRARGRRRSAEARDAASSCPLDGPRAARLRRQPGRARAERARVEAFGDGGPGGPPPLRRARLRARCAAACRAPDYRLLAVHRRLRRRARRRRPRRSRARAARSGSSRRPGSRRCSSRTRSRPPTTRRRTRATSSAAGGAVVVPETELGRVPELVRSLLDDPGRLAAMGEAMLARRAAGRGRRDRRGAARACRRLRAGGSGSSGSAAPGCARYALARAGVGRRGRAAGTASRRRTSSTCARPGSTSTIAPEPPDAARRLGGGRLDRVSPAVSPGGRARSSSPSSSRCAVDRRRRRARQDDDGGDDRVRASTGSASTRRS